MGERLAMEKHQQSYINPRQANTNHKRIHIWNNKHVCTHVI